MRGATFKRKKKSGKLIFNLIKSQRKILFYSEPDRISEIKKKERKLK